MRFRASFKEVGPVPAGKTMEPKTSRKKPKHKKPPFEHVYRDHPRVVAKRRVISEAGFSRQRGG
jgi:hypothetical protein